jgi:hypothetical protein
MHALARPCHFSARDRSPRTRRARGWAAGLACRHDTHLLGQSCPRIRRRALHTLPRPSSGALHLAKARGTARARPRALHCTLATSTDASATLWPKFSRRVSLMGDDRQHAPATLRNRDFILDVLRDVLPTTGVILEIASGSGEHVVHFAKCFPRLVFQPSDPDLDARFSIAAWTRAAGVENVHAPIAPRRVGTCLANRIGRRDHLQYPYGIAALSLWSVPTRRLRNGPEQPSGRAEPRDRNPPWGLRDLEAISDCALRWVLDSLSPKCLQTIWGAVFRQM